MIIRRDDDPVLIAHERRIGRGLIALTYVAVALLVAGVALMIVGNIDPLSGGPAFDPATLVADLLALDAAGPLWLGILLVLAIPIARVVAAGTSFARRGQWRMVGVAVAILVVIAIAIASALLMEP
jgi:uncharacterized membrane protein